MKQHYVFFYGSGHPAILNEAQFKLLRTEVKEMNKGRWELMRKIWSLSVRRFHLFGKEIPADWFDDMKKMNESDLARILHKTEDVYWRDLEKVASEHIKEEIEA